MKFYIIIAGLLGLLLAGCQTGVYHTVTKGQTLYRISRTYQVNETYLARVNGISDPSQLRIGTRLFIPGATRQRSVPVVRPDVPPALAVVPQPAPKSQVAKPAAPVAPAAPARQPSPPRGTAPDNTPAVLASKAPPATTVKKLQWPLRGKIVRTFSDQGKAGGGKGIEIAVRAGSDVSAAEAGKVIYSGDGVKGYGFLVILQHENDLFTVYGFNQRNLVRQGDYVSKGEKVALSGIPPGGGKPRLHFEVRKGKTAVNPILYLP
ncbi:M23 family metallopeptidase [Pelobacter seleniigenes]|uniref:M23 family metallopeptidase n=1 Tax=Pelobacter seleniigenes TaxID=407188 RepID=UPI00068E9FFC|nr:M23 family metallopeptidase [Pelobacter seleniigenes]